MLYIKRLILFGLCFVAIVFSGTVTAGAATTNLPAGVLIGDDSGLTVKTDGEYFIDATKLKAGDVILKKLTIRNMESYSYKISMTAQPNEERGPLKLLDEVNCRLVMDGKQLYNGRARGDEDGNMILDALDLGVYRPGDQKTLEITLTVSKDMPRYYTQSEAWFTWQFYAARQEAPEKPPHTGELIAQYWPYAVLLAASLASAVLILLKKKRTDDQQKEAGLRG
ncbi:MAG: hypothetical protein LBJ12_03765 [Oscillospiraceae bacterium]|jgi:hypothetical protein|nr:hypothetical protein [Oscillospiraceae bacterium]